MNKEFQELYDLFPGYVFSSPNDIFGEYDEHYVQIKSSNGKCYYPFFNNYKEHLLILNDPYEETYLIDVSKPYKEFNEKVKDYIKSQPKSFMIINVNHPFFGCAIKDILNE